MPVEKAQEGDEFQILTNSGVYTEHHYKKEQELERLVVSHADEVFGKSTIYFDLKQRVQSKLHAKVTDGLLLDFWKKPVPHLWVVEYELGSHDLERHVIPQLRGFVKAFDNEETITALRSSIYDEMTSNSEKLKKFKELAGEKEEVYLTIDKALQGETTILLVYDRLPSNIEQIFYESDFDYDTRFMVFRTFERDGQLVHLVNPLLPFETGGGERVQRVVESRKPGEKLNQVLEVVVLMKAGQSWNKACHEVASKKGIWHNTVMSATTRGLGLSGKTEFENYLKEGKLASLLIKRYPEARDRIESVFRQ